ncbi:MAG: hypothetical protein ABH862_06960 [Candidatus Omnitrophota bacterium]
MKKIITAAIGVICILGLTSNVYAGNNEYEYWDNGKVRTCTKYDDTGTKANVEYFRTDGSVEQFIKYDDNGEKIAEANYSSSGELAAGPDGWAAMMWQYEDGNMTAEGYYGSGGRLKEYKMYNASGDLVDKKYVGDDIDPSEEYDPMPTVSGETNEYYDSTGRPEGETTAVPGGVIFPMRWRR